MDVAAGSGSETHADLELVRVCLAPEGAFGVILVDGVPAGPVTLERTYPVVPARPSGAQYVKIPPGLYRCERTSYVAGGYATYEVTNVLGHSRLLFHAGNVAGDSDGCVLVGLAFGLLAGKPAVLASRAGHGQFMALACGRSSFWLRIKGPAA